jgi:hypothetical protein
LKFRLNSKPKSLDNWQLLSQSDHLDIELIFKGGGAHDQILNFNSDHTGHRASPQTPEQVLKESKESKESKGVPAVY